jgi:AcrR family transcriptional regulator
MPRTEAANQRIRAAQRAKILAAAWSAFAQKGYAATMADVAAAAGVSHGLVYRYFAGKEAIFQALVEQTLQAADAALQSLGELPGTPGKRLDALLLRMVESRHDHPEAAQLYQQVLSDEATPPALRASAARHAQALQHTLRRLIVEGQASGEVCAADPDQLVTAVLAVLEGLTRLAFIYPRRFREHFPQTGILVRMLKAEARDRHRHDRGG